MLNFYELLNVKSTASQEELKRNYKQLILQCHPDKLQQHGEHEEHEASIKSTTRTTDKESTDLNMTKKRKKFLAINEAWNTLKDPIKRKLYDAELLQTKFQMHNNVYDTITCNEMRREVWLQEEDDDDGDDEDDDENDDSDKEEKESKKYNENEALGLSSVGTTESEVLENYVDDNVRENHVSAAAVVDDDEDNKEFTTTTTTRVYYVYDCRCGGQYALDESAYETLREGDNNKHKDDDNKHSLCRNDKSSSSSSSTKSHHHHQQQQQPEEEEDNNEVKANQKEEKLHQNQQQQKRTSVIMSVDDGKVVSSAAATTTHEAYGDGNGNDADDVDDCIAKQNQARNEVYRGVVEDDGDDDDGVEGAVDVEVDREDNIADNDDEVIVECNECSLTHHHCLYYILLIPALPCPVKSLRILLIERKMASTGDIWLQWFSCCFHQPPQSPSRRRHHHHQHQRLRIDRSMIGNPTNFVHTGHIGSADVELSTNHLNALSTQMQSKGGYEMNSIRLHAC